MYDWANSAFATTVMAALFPPFYRALATHAGLSPADATASWGYTTAFALLVIALVAPVLGAVSDYTGGKKRFVAFFVGLGVLATAAFTLLGATAWRLAGLLFVCANVGFAGANLFYESLLPHVAGPDEIDRVSSRGYALGYVGGGVLLALNAAWVVWPDRFGFPSVDAAVRASFLSVAAWWGVFSVPFFRRVAEPPADRRGGTHANCVAAGFSRLASTLRHIRSHRQLALFLLAFWIYNDGISTIIKMATAYGHEIGIGISHMTAALVVTQFVGIPSTFLFARIARAIGAKRTIYITLVVYTLISIGGFFMRNALHFFLLASMVGTVQGGSQALSRSVFGSMVPRGKSAECFGFYSTSAKFAGIAGPLIFAVVSQLTGRSRLGIVSLVGFFVIGALVLSRVDIEEGRRAARAPNPKIGLGR